MNAADTRPVPGADAPRRADAPWRRLVGLAVLCAVVGGLGFGLGHDARAGLSYLAGLAVALLVVTLGAVLVELAGRILPALAMIAALTNYLMTVVVFVLILRAVGPATAFIPAFAAGLASAVLPYLAWQFHLARPRP